MAGQGISFWPGVYKDLASWNVRVGDGKSFKMNRQVQIKSEQIARWVIAGRKGTWIAEQLGMSYAGLMRIYSNPEYREIENDVRQRVLGQMDTTLDKSRTIDDPMAARDRERASARAKIREDYEDNAVPAALQVLVDKVKKNNDLTAAIAILDRDPSAQFVKQSPKPASPQQSQTVAPATLPPSVLDATVTEADLAQSVIMRSQQQRPAEA